MIGNGKVTHNSFEHDVGYNITIKGMLYNVIQFVWKAGLYKRETAKLKEEGKMRTTLVVVLSVMFTAGLC
ncbi:MAG: hypothetical protein NTZ78_03675, partial [Candidatus Aureabacteria bacterium]|nr:hypothetical protein [Candidatus Auribacterota bacterium]